MKNGQVLFMRYKFPNIFKFSEKFSFCDVLLEYVHLESKK